MKKTNENFDPDIYSGYSHTETEMLRLRRITREEYEAIPLKYRSRAMMLLSLTGLFFAICAVLTLCGLIVSVIDIIYDEKNAVAGLMVSVFVGGSFTAFAGFALSQKLDRLVSPDSLAAAGTVISAEDTSSNRYDPSRYKYRIALPSNQTVVTVRERHFIDKGATVLIIKSPAMQYHLVEIPASAADLTSTAKDYSAEILGGRYSPCYDLSEFDKIELAYAEKHMLSDSEYESIPKAFRSVNPFRRGWVTVFWLAFTLLTLILLAFLIKSGRAHDSLVFFPLMAGFICDMIIELFLTNIALKNPLPRSSTYCIDCIATSKASLTGQGMISAVIPEKKQYISQINIDSACFRSLPTDVPIRLYFSGFLSEAKYVEVL